LLSLTKIDKSAMFTVPRSYKIVLIISKKCNKFWPPLCTG